MEVIGTRAAVSVGLTPSTPLVPLEGNTGVGTVVRRRTSSIASPLLSAARPTISHDM